MNGVVASDGGLVTRERAANRALFHACDEFMSNSLVWFQALIGVPTHTLCEKVEKRLIVTFQHLRKGLRGWATSTSLGGDGETRFSNRIKEQLSAGAFLNEVLFRWSKDFHNACELLLLVFTREYRDPSEEFRHNASNTPHINRQAIGHSKYNLGGSVESRLNVRVDLLIFKTTGAEVDDLNLRVHGMGEENVLGLEVAVNDFVLLEHYQAAQELFGKTPNDFKAEAAELVGFDELVQIHVK